MKYITAGLCLIAASNVMGQQVCFDDGRYWTTPTHHFINHNNGTATHLSTGLMWRTCLEGISADCSSGEAMEVDWQTALKQADDVNQGDGYAGFNDWRLPNAKEIASIMEFACSNPSLNAFVFENMPEIRVWTSTPSENVTFIGEKLKSWAMDYAEGELTSSDADRDSQSYGVHLVRGAQ